jgi:RNA polymerase sigma-70 factor (ECF subfamily)
VADLQLVAKQDQAALRRLYNATSPRLFAICVQVTHGRSMAEDVLQDVYIKVWHRAAEYQPTQGHPLAWLTALARNSAIDAVRCFERRQRRDQINWLEAPESTPAIDGELITEQQEAWALALIDTLEERQQTYVRSVYLSGLSYSEIARRAGVPAGTVKSSVHRALRTLSRLWNNKVEQQATQQLSLVPEGVL